VVPIVVLVGTDERIYHYRHPIPTKKIMEQYAMLVLGGRREGLVCSLTRLVHFGALDDDLRRKMEAVAEVDAAMIGASQPGATLGDVFKAAQQIYARAGFADEWQRHHQGGLAGYTPREALGTPGARLRLEPGMACAWNPSITGAKSEDTFLVPEPGGEPEILTPMYGWPIREIEVNGIRLERPLIMELQ
jgi:antitoxin VapB